MFPPKSWTGRKKFVKKFMRSKWLGAVLIWVTCSSATAVESGPLNFQKTLKWAEEVSPSLGIIRGQLRIRELEKKNSVSVFLPQLDLRSENQIFRNSTDVVRPDYASFAGLYLTQTIYDNHLSITRYQTAGLQYEIAQLEYNNERDRLYLAVAEEFFNYSLAMKLFEVQEAQYNIIRKQFNTLQAQYQQGLKTRRDYLRFKSDLRRSEIELKNARASIERSLVALYRVIGVEQVGDYKRVTFVPLDVHLTLKENVPTGAPDITTHYQYRIAELRRRIFDNDVYIVKRQYWPVINLSAGGYHAYNDYLGTGKRWSDIDAQGWSANLTLTFNLWDWGIRNRNIQIASEQRSVGQRNLAIGLNEFSAGAQNTLIQMEQSLNNFNLGKELLDLESTNYNFLEREYRNGTVSYLDLITSLRNLLNAKITVFTNYYELQSQILRYKYNEGTLYGYVEKI